MVTSTKCQTPGPEIYQFQSILSGQLSQDCTGLSNLLDNITPSRPSPSSS
ncbi:hypothetical protein BgiBS90_034308 [Biomphalaria glabrata]|nr:hypothetical protein BgiBS90_034308 [Biomphalaria glabrata]